MPGSIDWLFSIFIKNYFVWIRNLLIFDALLKTGALSSVGLEHLVYTEGVGGSNPSAPTLRRPPEFNFPAAFFLFIQLNDRTPVNDRTPAFPELFARFIFQNCIKKHHLILDISAFVIFYLLIIPDKLPPIRYSGKDELAYDLLWVWLQHTRIWVNIIQLPSYMFVSSDIFTKFLTRN